MNDQLINDCITDLLDNYSQADLIYFARCDDGAYTVYDHGTPFDVDVIGAALDIILDRLT